MIFGCISENFQTSNFTVHSEYKQFFKSANLFIYYNNYNCLTECEKNIVIVYGDIYNTQNKVSEIISEKKSKNLPVHEYISDLSGEFLIIIYLKKENILEIYKDQFGFIPLYFATINENLFFSTQIKQIYKALPEKPQIDFNWLIYSTSGNRPDKSITPFLNIQQIPETSYLKYDHNNHTFFHKKYWDINTNHKASCSQDEYIEIFKEKLIASIKKRINNERIISTELSGGLDSSAVTSIAAAGNPNKIFAYSHIIDKKSNGINSPYNDESVFSENVASKFDNITHVKIDGSDISLLELLTNNIKQLYYCSNINYLDFISPIISHSQKENSNIILSGFGGDQAVSNHGFAIIKEKLKSIKLNNLNKYINQIKCVYNYSKPKIILSSISNIYLQNIINHLKPSKKIKLLNFYQRDFLVKTNFKKILKKEPRKKFISFNDSVKEFLEVQYNYDRITICSELALANDIKYKFPLLDKELICFYFSIPPEFKTSATISRYLFRESLKDFLPEEIRLRNDKSGSTIPSVTYLFLKDADNIEAFINKCKNTLSYNIFNYDEILRWHKELKNSRNNSGKIRMTNYFLILKQLIFLYLYENNEL